MKEPADDTPLHLQDLLPTTPDGRQERLECSSASSPTS